jgi:murein DD-endopeptidase MepM/ murein hydrolase activator NlpD
MLLFSILLSAAVPGAFEQLGTSLEADRTSVATLAADESFKGQRELFERYSNELDTAFEVGVELDRAIESSAGDTEALRREYLGKLRQLQKLQKRLYRVYADALNQAMREDERELFVLLLNTPMEPLKNRHVRERVKSYYEKRAAGWELPVARKLLREMAFEQSSRMTYAQEMQAYRTRVEMAIPAVAVPGERRLIRRFKNLAVYAVPTGNGYGIFAENSNPYSVTSVINFSNLKNFAVQGKKSETTELESRGSAKVADLVPIERGKPSSLGFDIMVVMGWASARHDPTVRYRVPFKIAATVIVSQGFDGAATHKGNSRYAVDFQVPVGTEIYAARPGKVVATEGKYTHGGFDERLAAQANYILIEHDDKTYGQYAHLKYNGVAVRVGERVAAGSLIGYSGNTGYSSGPHLHFEVVKVDPVGKNRMLSIPVRFKSGGKTVTNPKQGDRYIVTR